MRVLRKMRRGEREHYEGEMRQIQFDFQIQTNFIDMVLYDLRIWSKHKDSNS